MCGEHITPREPCRARYGSSPRVRGTRRRPRGRPRPGRFIPACAGNTDAGIGANCRRPVHPRVCGEHRRGDVVHRHGRGSSPRVRGTPRRRIPTASSSTVHPRVCGEHNHGTGAEHADHGSSPRVRGTRRKTASALPPKRFIPACAGNTNVGTPAEGGYAGSSPRVRGTPVSGGGVAGERRFIPACAGNTHQRYGPIGQCSGSSPRVRGTLDGGGHPDHGDRFIPACAGNTGDSWPPLPRSPVHPRVCGEHDIERVATVGVDRFIPACAGNTAHANSACQCWPVHPRVCGEHSRRQPAGGVVSGSSPRVRGTRSTGGAIALIIRVHPRVCGEHRKGHRQRVGVAGSSPRVRGTRDDDRHHVSRQRFIPACAGNTGGCPRRTHVDTVHPRVCGEHLSPTGRFELLRGSSPRVRGTHSWHGLRGNQRRFIPACAGNTRELATWMWMSPVHPRVCGEHVAKSSGGVKSSGSSPRVRGTPTHSLFGIPQGRFIPACAGNTSGHWRTAAKPPVHPRVCGEHSGTRELTICSNGSSPRVRGTRLSRRSLRLPTRFIPACAGNTSNCSAKSTWTTVHPRVCGEHLRCHRLEIVRDGSSPRVRGTQKVHKVA